jgi:hypothetical protein
MSHPSYLSVVPIPERPTFWHDYGRPCGREMVRWSHLIVRRQNNWDC